MRAEQMRKFAMLRRVQQYLDMLGARFGIINGARKQFDQLVAEMGANESTQAISTLNARSQTALQAALRRDLVVHHMRPVATIAAAHLREVPGFAALQMHQRCEGGGADPGRDRDGGGGEIPSAGVRGQRPSGKLCRRPAGRGGGRACLDRLAGEQHNGPSRGSRRTQGERLARVCLTANAGRASAECSDR